MKKFISVLLCFAMLWAFAGCQEPDVVDTKGPAEHYVRYFLSYTDNLALPSDMPAVGENLYKQEKITVGSPIAAPADPVREGYTFGGWYTDRELTAAYDFTKAAAAKDVILYAKWDRVGEVIEGEKEYFNTLLTFTEKTHAEGEAFLWNAVLNGKVVDGAATVTKGALARLEANADNVKELLDYSRLETTVVTGAVYDKTTKVITVSYTDNGEAKTVTCTVAERTTALSNSTYETKAGNYEQGSANAKNYEILFCGSSSMEYWTTSTEDMFPMLSMNHGIGGTTSVQWRDVLAERLIYPYNPRAVVLYVGVNDIINGVNGVRQTGEATGNVVLQLLQNIHTQLPDATVYYVLINSLPGYGKFQTEFDNCNKLVSDFAEANEWAHVIDAGAGLMKESGKPNVAYFRNDGLHMSTYGYVIWGRAVKDYIFETEKEIYKK